MLLRLETRADVLVLRDVTTEQSVTLDQKLAAQREIWAFFTPFMTDTYVPALVGITKKAVLKKRRIAAATPLIEEVWM